MGLIIQCLPLKKKPQNSQKPFLPPSPSFDGELLHRPSLIVSHRPIPVVHHCPSSIIIKLSLPVLLFRSCNPLPCLHYRSNHHSQVIRAKWSFIMCRFLYAYLVFLCIFLWFYVCFNVLESFWKETEEMSKNWAKTSKMDKIGKKLKNYQGRKLAPFR